MCHSEEWPKGYRGQLLDIIEQAQQDYKEACESYASYLLNNCTDMACEEAIQGAMRSAKKRIHAAQGAYAADLMREEAEKRQAQETTRQTKKP